MKIRSFQWQIVKIKLLHMYQKCLYSKSMTRHLLEFGYNLVTTFYEKAFNHYPNFVVWCKCIFGVFFLHFVEFFWVNWTIFRSPTVEKKFWKSLGGSCSRTSLSLNPMRLCQIAVWTINFCSFIAKTWIFSWITLDVLVGTMEGHGRDGEITYNVFNVSCWIDYLMF